VGDVTVRRLLPLRTRRSVGAWCFVDHYGPMSVDGVAGMQVPPHPHIGLQTVTWLMRGNVLHRDSLGSEQMIRPGQLNLMTAGRGIAHAEESPAERDPQLHGVQLWVALPDVSRQADPAFEHHAELPTARVGEFEVTVFMGELAGARSPATAFSPIVGAELAADGGARTSLPLDVTFEHVVFVAAGAAEVGGVRLRPGQLLYLGPGRERASMVAAGGSRLVLHGGCCGVAGGQVRDGGRIPRGAADGAAAGRDSPPEATPVAAGAGRVAGQPGAVRTVRGAPGAAGADWY
jgi:quercetin 2,3-dioxygenase